MVGELIGRRTPVQPKASQGPIINGLPDHGSEPARVGGKVKSGSPARQLSDRKTAKRLAR
jgi:hypothetical protein